VLQELVKTYGKHFGPTTILGQTQLDILIDSSGNSSIRGTRERYVVRSHPDYQSAGPWYEWCMFEFEESHGSSHPSNAPPGVTPLNWFPGKILAIFKHPRPEGTSRPDKYQPPKPTADDDSPNDPEEIGASRMMCLIHTCSASNHQSDSRLTEVWEKEFKDPKGTQKNGRRTSNQPHILVPRLRIVPVETIVKRIYVVEEYPQVVDYFPRQENNNFSRVVYVKDMMEYWPLSFDRTVVASQ
jgi:hypothetical protein